MNNLKRISQYLLPVLLLCCLVLSAAPAQAGTDVPAQLKDEKTSLVINLLPGSYFNNIKAGEETHLYLEVRNQGDSTITGIRFAGGLPKDWVIKFVPAELAALTPGSSNIVDVFIVPGKKSRGDFNVTLLAEADQTKAATTAFFNIENKSMLWLWISIALGVVVVAGFVIVFIRQNKH